MKPNTIARPGVAAAALTAWMLVPTTASAQDQDLFAELAEGTQVHAVLESGVNYTDNFFFTDQTRNQDEAAGLLVRPEVKLARVSPRLAVALNGNAEFGWFDLPGDVDDYSDFGTSLAAAWQSALRHRFSFTGSYLSEHDPFGTERTENTPLENRALDEWRQVRNQITYRYGLPTDRYNVEMRVDAFNKEYTTNRDFTQFLDHERASGQIFGFYNFTSKASAFITAYAGRTNYEEVLASGFDRSANEFRYAIGTRWNATARTSGDIRIGYIQRKPRDDSRDEFTSLDWNAAVTWSPRSVRSFRLESGRSSQESFLNTVDFIDNRYVNLVWNEQWTTRLHTRLAGRYVDSEFVGTPRRDDSLGVDLETQYLITRALKLIAAAGAFGRDSNVGFAEYDRFTAYVGARYSR